MASRSPSSHRSLAAAALFAVLFAGSAPVSKSRIANERVGAGAVGLAANPDGSATLKSSCYRGPGCVNDSVGALQATRFTCTRATGSDPRNYPPACYVTCTPNCGEGRFEPGNGGATSGAGTITLACNGQWPLECELRVEKP